MVNWKRIIIACLIVFFVIFTVLDVWWLYILMYMPDKDVVNTYYLGQITTEPEEPEEPQSEYIFKVKYFSNENKNGFECLELEFTGFRDETKDSFYHIGMQFISNTENDTLDSWNIIADTSTREYNRKENTGLFGINNNHYYNVWSTAYPKNGSMYSYQSSDNFTYDVSNNYLSIDNLIVSFGNDKDIFKLAFKNHYIDKEFDNYMGRNFTGFYQSGFGNLVYNYVYYDYYVNYDANAFACYMYNSIKAFSNGKHSASLIQFPNLFDYAIYDGNTFNDVSEATNSKVNELRRDMYTIYIEKYADGIQTANDSLFKKVKGSSEFNYVGDDGSSIIENGDYFSGKTVVDCDIYDFDFVNIRDNLYALKLNSNFCSYYEKYSEYIKLSICIDLDVLSKNNIEFYGFTSDSGLSKFDVYECYTLKNENGQPVKLEVSIC